MLIEARRLHRNVIWPCGSLRIPEAMIPSDMTPGTSPILAAGPPVRHVDRWNTNPLTFQTDLSVGGGHCSDPTTLEPHEPRRARWVSRVRSHQDRRPATIQTRDTTVCTSCNTANLTLCPSGIRASHVCNCSAWSIPTSIYLERV